MSSLVTVVECIASDLEASTDQLNRLDGMAGDGDLGITAAIVARSMVALLPELEGLPMDRVLSRCGIEIAKRAPSTGGTLAATGLMAAGRTLGAQTFTRDVDAYVASLAAASEAIAARGKAKLGDKTMLDALFPAADAAREAALQGGGLEEVAWAAAEAAKKGAEATTGMVAVHGRAGWLAERSFGHVDAGACAVSFVLWSLARAFDSDARPGESFEIASVPARTE
jgi:dihydroxyacetone kinase-like protein